MCSFELEVLRTQPSLQTTDRICGTSGHIRPLSSGPATFRPVQGQVGHRLRGGGPWHGHAGADRRKTEEVISVVQTCELDVLSLL